MTMTVHEKVSTGRQEISKWLIERDAEVDMLLTALVCKEHALMVGAPGTAKSLLARGLVSMLGGQRFSILLTKFTTPEEVCGPVSVIGLKEDHYRRITEGYLPTADVAFLDEIWKASSAILNTFLTMLEERIYKNDGHDIKCPLKIAIGCSNEYPGDQEGGKELNALFDRFLFRKSVRPVGTSRGLERLLWSDIQPLKVSVQVDEADLDTAYSEVSRLPWSENGRTAFRDVVHTSRKEGIRVGDRRLRKSIMACQGYAWLNGATEVEPDHMEICEHVLWEDPAEQPKKLAEIIGTIANPVGMKVNARLLEAEEIIASADLKDLAKTSVADKKLSAIHKELSNMGARAANAADYVAEERKKMRVAAFSGSPV
jgi:MoxR-like ATPase